MVSWGACWGEWDRLQVQWNGIKINKIAMDESGLVLAWMLLILLFNIPLYLVNSIWVLLCLPPHPPCLIHEFSVELTHKFQTPKIGKDHGLDRRNRTQFLLVLEISQAWAFDLVDDRKNYLYFSLLFKREVYHLFLHKINLLEYEPMATKKMIHRILE